MRAPGISYTFHLPGGVAFRQPLAGPMARMCACILDLILAVTTGSVLGMLLLQVFSFSFDVGIAMFTLANFLVFFGYQIVFEIAWRGQTPGKRLCRLRVIDAAGLELRAVQVIMRNILRLVDLLPGFYLLGGLVSYLHPHRQRLGDLAANTLVVTIPKPFQPDLDQVEPGRHNSFLERPDLCARLRQLIGPEEAALLLQSVLRREAFHAEARPRLFAEAAEWLKTLVKFPDEMSERLTDEQYVRNVVAILYTRPKKAN